MKFVICVILFAGACVAFPSGDFDAVSEPDYIETVPNYPVPWVARGAYIEPDEYPYADVYPVADEYPVADYYPVADEYPYADEYPVVDEYPVDYAPSVYYQTLSKDELSFT